MSTTSGKLFTATIGTGTPVVITGLTKGDIKIVGDDLDSTDSDSAPWTDADVGCIGAEGSLEGHFRAGGMQYPTLSMGSELADLKVYPHGIAEDPYHFPLAICGPGTTTSEVRGKVTYQINFKNKGAFTIPGE